MVVALPLNRAHKVRKCSPYLSNVFGTKGSINRQQCLLGMMPYATLLPL